MKYLQGIVLWIAFIIFAIFVGGTCAWAVGTYAALLGYPYKFGGVVGTVIAYLVVTFVLKQLHTRKQAEQ